MIKSESGRHDDPSSVKFDRHPSNVSAISQSTSDPGQSIPKSSIKVYVENKSELANGDPSFCNQNAAIDDEIRFCYSTKLTMLVMVNVA